MEKLGTGIQNIWNNSVKPTLLKIGRLGGNSAEEGIQRWKNFAIGLLKFFGTLLAIGAIFGLMIGLYYIFEANKSSGNNSNN